MSSSTDDVVVRLRLADVARFIRDVRSGRLAIDELEARIRRAGSTARSESGEYGGLGLWGATIGRMKYAVAGLSLTLLAGVGAAAKFAISSTAGLEQIEIGFKTLLGSSSAADAMIDKLRAFNKETPFELKDLLGFTQSLLAAGVSGQQVVPVLTSIGDAVAAFGGGKDQMEGIITAMQQMAISGRVYTQDINQLVQRKVNVYPWLAQALGITQPQVKKMIYDGKLASSRAIPIILRGMETAYGGAAKAQAKTLTGTWSNIIDAATEEVTARMKPFRPMMKKWLTDLYDHIPEIADSIAGAIGGAVGLAQKAWAVGSGLVGSVKVSAQTGGPTGLGESLGALVPKMMTIFMDRLTSGAGKVDWFDIGTSVGKGAVGFAFGFMKGIFDLGAWGSLIKKHWLDMILILVSLFPAGKGLGVIGKVLEKIPLIRAFAPLFTKTGAAMAKVGGPVWKLVTGIGKAVWESFGRVFPAMAFRLEYGLLRLGEMFGRSEHSIWAKAARWARRVIHVVVTNLLDSIWRAIGKLTTSLYGLVVAPLLGLIPQVRDAAVRLWHSLPDEFKKAMNQVIGWWNHLKFPLPGGHSIGVPNMSLFHTDDQPGLANGGILTSGGSVKVGERGEEILNLPRGASVVPLPRVGGLEGATGGAIPPIEVTLMLDGDVLMRRVIRAQDTAMARL